MIGIITDSTCDIPQNLIDQYGIIVIPQVVIWDGVEYSDRIDLQPQDFYRRLKEVPTRPTSSQPSVPSIAEVYQKAVAQGADELVVLTVSSAMSGTYQVALQAAAQVEVPVAMIDSKGPTMTLGWQVLAAARARDAGADARAIVDCAANARARMVQYVGMDTLEYLQRGGRIGNAIKWVGTMLQVRPLVKINHASGLVEPVTLARTHKALVNSMYTRFFEDLAGGKNLHIAVLHGDCEDAARELAGRIRAEYAPAELLVNITGPVLGINTGPGALALCGYSDNGAGAHRRN